MRALLRDQSTASGAQHRSEVEALLQSLAAAHGPRYRLLPGPPPPGEAGAWLRADRLFSPDSPELVRLLDSEYHGSGHRTEHAAALTLIAVYAGWVTAAGVLQWALDGRVLDLRPENVLVRPAGPEGHGIAGVRMYAPRLVEPGRASVHATVLGGHLLPLAEALHRRTRAGLRQLRGGVAHGCATALCASAAPVEEMAVRWREFAGDAPGGLAGLGDVERVTRSSPSPGRTSRLVYLRRTCCLFYTSAEAVRCASCCLTPREERLRAYAART
ncbi:(2Fe-2S)-binding protein [Streptomyces sp. ODS28]|uniref:(2Fe-2S)-binding protein n=1 Tax=Streptomyces sp. ODS28 TaxID=3136688 RepID=UPI0031E5B06C